jgi:hypothetical protein
MTLSFVNTQDVDINVPWLDGTPAFTLRRRDANIVVHRSCVPDCTVGCTCDSCILSSTVRVVPPGSAITLSWVPLHYIENTCQAEGYCRCYEPWPITAGQYALTLAGFTHAEGGDVDPADPSILTGAARGTQARSCTAALEFVLQAEAWSSDMEFVCER